MSKKDDDNVYNGKTSVDTLPWIEDQNLDCKAITLSTLCATEYIDNGSSKLFFQYHPGKHYISFSQQEDKDSRKPSLSRALVPSSSNESIISKHNGCELFRATDAVPGYWKRSKKSDEEETVLLVPSTTAVSMLQHRLDTFVYESVLNDWLRHLVVMAAIEECRNQFLQQCSIAGTANSSNGTRTKTSSSSNNNNTPMELSSSSPPYYRQSPSSYLSAPVNIGASNGSNTSELPPGFASVPFQFSPSQLVQRIKQGCTLVWRDFERRLPSTTLAAATTSAILSLDRRSSSRLSRLQQMELDVKMSVDSDPTYEWKGLPGGQIASFLRDRLILKDLKEDFRQTNGIHETSTNKANPRFESSDADSDENTTRMFVSNPYLRDSESAILEWLGRKTAKFLTTADIQPTFQSLLPPKPKLSKKKSEPPPENTEILGVNVLDYLSALDLRIWKRMLSDAHTLEEANGGPRLYLKIVNDEDTSRLADWEASSFGRSQFTIRIWNEAAALKMTLQALDCYAAAETEYKEKKGWGTWRHKGITTGFTIWPSWLKTMDKWRKEESDTMDELSKSHENEIVIDHDLELAKSLAGQDAAATSLAGSRRSRRAGGEGGNVGVFYGAHANLNHKQLMDALLRLISTSSYQTSSSLASTVLDNSSDPHRRIRYAIGKLLWKRNQISRIAADPGLSDGPVTELIDETPLLTFDSGATQISPLNMTSEEIKELLDYIRELQKTESFLRQLVMDHITAVPVGVIATSADEKIGSLETADFLDFDAEDSDIQWMTDGHKLLKSIIFRPPSIDCSDEILPCQWFKVKEFCESVISGLDDIDGSNDRPQIGRAKECIVVKRRQRFRVTSTSNPFKTETRQKYSNNVVLVLTEAQVYAGMKAAEIEQKQSSLVGCHENPYAASQSKTITMIPSGRSSSQCEKGLVVGHDSFVDRDGSLQHRILVLPDKHKNEGDAKWAKLIFRDQGTIDCAFESNSSIYTLQRFEFQPGSEAFKECRGIVQFLSRHAKAGPFLEPVDPMALGIPQYNDVIKDPMDISTIAKNLENGLYSNFASNKSVGKSPVARMLNGPFRRDIELMFDNAMLFNSPDDWIHLSAAALKKAVCKKIELISSTYEHNQGKSSTKSSLYVDADSDFEFEEDESDLEEYVGAGKRRKRKSSVVATTVIKEEASTRSIERPLRLQKLLSDVYGVRGALANMPIVTDATTFSLPAGWGCRFAAPKIYTPNEEGQQDDELDEIIALQKLIDERDFTSRRSTRTVHDVNDRKESIATDSPHYEFYALDNTLVNAKCDRSSLPNPENRLQLETVLETLHENYFAKLYHGIHKSLVATSDDAFGVFAESSFPPYLGHVVPRYVDSKLYSTRDIKWEIRDTYLVPALRWVIRGLIRSEHLFEQESIDSVAEAGSILPNFIYYFDPHSQPYEVLDGRESAKKKRTANGVVNDVSDDDIELSEYEKMRAERVARNAERLKLLGLT
jgi:Bromodomain